MKKLGKHGGRVIVRNIPFSIPEKVLKAWLEKIGPLKELKIPMSDDNKRNKGFAFIEFEKKNISEKAIQKLNGQKLQNREISLDWALSKDTYLESIKKEELEKEFKPAVAAEEEAIEEPAEEITEKEPAPKKRNFSEGKVLFLMNLNYLTEDEDLFERFKEFGKVKYAKIVRTEAGESKGTGFVCFEKAEVAEEVLKIAEDGIELDERRLKVLKAVSQEAAVNLKSNKPEKSDKRNLHLTKLSLILPGSKEFEKLTEKEVQLRTLAAKKMKEKLLNPNIFVSPTRLLFKNLSKVITQDDLKILVRKILTDDNPELLKKKLFAQVKVLKETEKFDKNGEPLSKGIAFIEFKKHEFALRAIQLCNNNSEFFGKFKPIVEFALEDHRVLRIRKLKLSQQKKKRIHSSQEKSSIGRGKRQRLKRKMMKASLDNSES